MNRYLFLILWGMLLLPSLIWSQSCCTATGSLDFARVGQCQTNVIAFTGSYTPFSQSYSTDGSRKSIEAYERSETKMQIGVGYKFFNTFQLNAIIPLLYQRMDFEALGSNDGLSLGDIRLGSIIHLIRVESMPFSLNSPKEFLPGVDLRVSLKTRSGTSMGESKNVVLRADVTSDGYYGYSAGISFVRFITMSHVVQYQFDYWAFTQKILEETEISKNDDRIQRISYLYIYNLFHSIGISASLNNKGAEKRHMWSLNYTHVVDFPRFEVSVGISAIPPYDWHNEVIPETGHSVTLGARYSFM